MTGWLRSVTPAQLRLALRWAGLGILLFGLGGSAMIWYAEDRAERATAATQTVNPSDPLPLLDSRKQVRQVEMYYGKTGVLAEKADALFHGKPLAELIAAGSAIVATGLFLVAARLPDPGSGGRS